MSYFVSTERLGWPVRRWWQLFVDAQTRLQYDIDPEIPTATCHLQLDSNQNAACGCHWEGLIPVPGQPRWSEIEEWLRCDECEAATSATERP